MAHSQRDFHFGSSLKKSAFYVLNSIYFPVGFRGGQEQHGLEITASVWASDRLMLQRETVSSGQQKTQFYIEKLKV